MTTAREDADFIKTVISDTLLEKAIEWIVDNMEPDDVFSRERLKSWAEDYNLIGRDE